MSIGKNGVFKQNMSQFKNLYSGQQYNASNMSLSYNYKTDIFKEYGYSTALKLTPTNTGTTQFMAYSYLMNPIEYKLAQEYTVFMYVYVSSDCNANFRLNLEHSNTWVSNYQGTTSNINDSTKGKVIKVWGKCKTSAADGKMYLMFYPNPNQANIFTTGYQLIAGITVMLGNEVIPTTGGFIQNGSESVKIHNHYINANDFIEL